MEQKEFRELKSSKEAHLILKNIKINQNLELLPLEKAIGRVLAEDICSEIDVPAFDRAIKDGFAVRAQDTYTATEIEPVKLNKTVSIAAGYISNLAVGSQEAIEIATGAQIPEGSDAIVMVEHTTIEEGDLLIKRAVHINENIMRTGADIMKGERVLRRNMRLGSREIGVLASIGLSKVRVRKLKVGIISTGDELLRPGSDLERGKIYDTNSYAIAASMEECGAHPVIYGIVKDNERSMSDIIDRALRECNMVLTSGSTSAGVGDIMYKIIAEKGNTLLHGISIKPGKPVVVGIIDNKPLIGLPGNPTSALSIINEFIAPMIYDSLEIAPPFRTKVKAIIGTGIRSEGREELFPVGLVRGRVYPADKTSGAITTLSEADGIIEISEETEYLEPGKQVDVTLFGNVPLVDVMFVGSQCPGIDLLEDMTGMNIRMINMGSSRGLSAMASGIADVAGINVAGPKEYNLEAIRSMGIHNAVLVKGYRREQGLIVRPESNIKNLEDLPGKKLANRNRGSGTRALLDKLLEKLAIKKSTTKAELVKTIPGYNSGLKTHRAVCEAIISDKADVGFGIRPFAETMGLKFIPITVEDFDFLINREIIDIPQVKSLLATLRSPDFAKELPPGIITYERTGEIIESI